MKYADPSRCPGCREELPQGFARCPHCDLQVRHPLARQVFATLTHADELLTRLRAESSPTASPAPPATPAAPPDAEAPGAPAARPAPPSPAATPPPPPPPAALAAPAGTGTLGVSSIPKLLLGLGAFCLIVAAVIFLAVSWQVMGVAGRTAVLLGFTAATGGAAYFLHRHDLRIGAEALSSVCLGLIALDVIGARSSGWFGDISGNAGAILVGLVLIAAGTGFALSTRPHLGAPQVTTAIGVVPLWVGLANVTEHGLIVGHVVVAATAGGFLASHRLGLTLQKWGLLAAGGIVWSVTAVTGAAIGLDDPTLADLWWHSGAGWSLVFSGATLLLPGLLLRQTPLLVWSGAGTAVLVTAATTVPVIDEGARWFAVTALAAAAVWTGVLVLLPRRVHPVAVVPAGVGALLLAGITATVGAVAMGRWAELGEPFSQQFTVGFDGRTEIAEPLVVVPAIAVVVALLALALPKAARPATWLTYGGLAAGAGGLLTLASYAVPLAAVAAAGWILTVATLGLALTHPTTGHRPALGVIALLASGVGCLVALPSSMLTLIAALLALVTAALLHTASSHDLVQVLGGMAAAPAIGLAFWAGASSLDLSRAWVGVPVIVALGVLAILRPRLEVEIPASLVAVLAMLVSAPAASDASGSWALHLTVLGALCAATALINEPRRAMIWPGLALVVLASWVRLAGMGVTAPEPYTVPLALVLLGLGLWHLHRNTDAGTAFALLPGLLLATVPSLLWVLADPISLRALLLGLACLALTIAGATLRWSAPLLVGAIVGGLVVLRELGPYAGSWPQWVWIGLAGALLTVVGLTWERRLLEVRKAVGFLGRLR